MKEFVRTLLSFHERKRKRLYIILIAFLISFACARAYSLFIVSSLFYHGFHLHHFYFGAAILWIGGIIAVLGVGNWADYVASAFLGVGMGLFADEIGLLLNCTTSTRVCAYAFPENSDIIAAIVLVIVVLMLSTGYMDYRSAKKELRGK
jgi:uncharacterized membrane protein YidH (DUF202 family)